MIFYVETNNGDIETTNFITSPAEALIIFKALDVLVNDEYANDDDKRNAERLIKEMMGQLLMGMESDT